MAYEQELADRVLRYFENREDIEVKKMFGGLCFMITNHMCCGITGNYLMLRVGPQNYESCLKKEFVSEMDFTGKAMKGMVYVSPEGIKTDKDLFEWLRLSENFVHSLPPKKPKKR